MMTNTKVFNFPGRTRCDSYKCDRIATHTIGNTDNPKMSYHNICTECLESIAHQVPLETVINRADLSGYIQSLIDKAVIEATEMIQAAMDEFMSKADEVVEKPEVESATALEMLTTKQDDRAEAIPFTDEREPIEDEEVPEIDEESLVKAYTWNELRAFAKELEIDGYGSMKRDEMEATILDKLRAFAKEFEIEGDA